MREKNGKRQSEVHFLGLSGGRKNVGDGWAWERKSSKAPYEPHWWHGLIDHRRTRMNTGTQHQKASLS